MTDHIWAQENLAAYVAAGLDVAERELLEQHVAGCAECRQSLDEARAADEHLGSLFADVRPSPGMEDRLIQTLRLTEAKTKMVFSRRWKVALTAASVLFLALTGFAVSAIIDQAEAGLRSQAQNNLKQMPIALDVSGSMSAREIGGRDVPDGGEVYLGGLKVQSEATQNSAQLAHVLREGLSFGIELGYEGRRGWYKELTHGHLHHGLNVPVPATNGTRQTPPGDQHYGGFAYRKEDETRKSKEAYGRQFGMESPAGSSSSKGPSTTPQGEIRTPKLPDWKFHKPGEGRAQFGQPEKEKGKADDLKADPKQPLGKLNPKLEGGDKDKDRNGEAQPEQAQPPAADNRKIIRTGELEFEIDSFDGAQATIIKLVDGTKGFVATINSQKLPNGKVRGSVVVRIPPLQLDKFVLDLRTELGKVGELKTQRIGSQDITKQYTDLESRLRAARTMEERILKIIKDSKGEVKDFIAAEKELGVWRTKIEEFEGELRYYANQVSLSSLTIGLTEKEIRVAAAVTEKEQVQAGIEAEDVEKALQSALSAIAEHKGRVTKSELKQLAAGQFNAELHFEVKPEAAGLVRDRLKQLGNMVRLEINRIQQAEDGGKLPLNGKLIRGDTQFIISIYNLANIEPRETVTLKVAAADVPAAFRTLREALGRLRGQVINATLKEQDRENISAQIDFSIRRTDESTLLTALATTGEPLSRQVSRAPEGEKVTDAKILFKVELVNANSIPPRELTTLGVEVAQVETTLAALVAQVKDAQGRVVKSDVAREANGQVIAQLVADLPLTVATGLVEKAKGYGQVRVQRMATDQNAPTGKMAVGRVVVTLSNAALLVPSDQGLSAQFHRGLSWALMALLYSVTFVIVGVVAVVPLALVIWGVVALVRRFNRGGPELASASGPAVTQTATEKKE